MKCKYCKNDAAFVCRDCGKGLCWNHARLKVVCPNCVPKHKEMEIRVRAGGIEDKPFVEKFKRVLLLSDEEISDNFSPNHFISIAEINSVPVGFVVLAKTSETKGCLAIIGVLPRYQRMGVGTRLMKSFVDKSKEMGLKELFATTSNENVPALMLYMKHGFKIVSIKHDVYKKYGICGFGVPGFDEVRLEMKL